MNQYKFFLLLIGFFFTVTVSADPLLHSYGDVESYQIECQFCKNDVSEFLNHNSVETKNYLSIIKKVEVYENYISITKHNYSPRAPPKI
jgi:hypothetical protein